MRVSREVVIQAAAYIADKEGFGKVSLKDVAEKLNIRTPSLYNHIESLDDLCLEVAHVGMRAMNDMMTQAALGFSGDTAIKAISNAYLQYVMAHPGVYEAIQWANWHGNDETQMIFNQYEQLLTKLIRPLHNKHNTGNGLVLVMSILHGYCSLQLSKALKSPEDAIKELTNVMDAALAGLR